MRTYTLNRWNWSERAGKWVYVRKVAGKRVYSYQIEPPKEFIDLTKQMTSLNEKLLSMKDITENEKVFNQMMEISKRLQEMGGPDF